MFEKKYEVYGTAVLSNGVRWQGGSIREFRLRSSAERYRQRLQKISDTNDGGTPMYVVGRIGYRDYSYQVTALGADSYFLYRVSARHDGHEIGHEYANSLTQAARLAFGIARSHKLRPVEGSLIHRGNL